MKQFLLAIFIITSALCLAQETATIDSKVSSVTIFRDRAMVTREGEAKLGKGIHKVILSNLPNEFDDASVRVSASGRGVIKILDVKVEYKAAVEAPEKIILAIDTRIDSLKLILGKLVDEISLFKKQKDVLNTFKAQISKGLNGKLSAGKWQTSEWTDLRKYFESGSREILDGQRIADQKRIRIEEQINLALKEKAQPGRENNKSYKEIQASIEIPETGTVALQASYLIRNANWSPLYDIRVNSSEKKGELHFFGMIRQSTGEDWNNVSVILSTAEPFVFKDLPLLSPWYIERHSERYPEAGANYIRGGRSDAVGSYFNGEAVSGKIPRVQEFSTIFNITTKYDIPSDNNAHKVEVAVTTLPISLEYTSIPKVSANVYLLGKMINTGDQTWLAGDVNIFIDDDYINRTIFNDVLPTDTLELSLGTDARIKIEKVLVNKFHQTKGVFNGTTKITYDYELRLTNNSKTHETVSVFDQLPVALEEVITVTPVDPALSFKDLPANKEIAWHLTLKPGEKKIVPFKFSIEYPSSQTIYGLE